MTRRANPLAFQGRGAFMLFSGPGGGNFPPLMTCLVKTIRQKYNKLCDLQVTFQARIFLELLHEIHDIRPLNNIFFPDSVQYEMKYKFFYHYPHILVKNTTVINTTFFLFQVVSLVSIQFKRLLGSFVIVYEHDVIPSPQKPEIIITRNSS